MATNRVPEHLQKPNNNHTQWLLRRIWDRVNRNNEHFMGVIVGREGSGKSYTAVKIAKSIDPSFTADRIIFDVASLLETLRDGNHSPGNFYVLDEAGVQLGKRTWQDRAQVLANQALQLIRDHNLGLLFTLPRLSELDSQTQGRLQAMVEMTGKEDGEYAEAKWKWLDPDRTGETGKVYKKYPRRRHKGQLLKVRQVAFTPPDEEVIQPYEERKDEFQEDFYDEVIDELKEETDGEGSEGDSDEMGPKDIATEIQNSSIEKYVSINRSNKTPYINKNLIQADYELSHRNAKMVKSLLEQQTSNNELKQYA